MLLTVKNANTDLPPLVFRIHWLSGGKYDGVAVDVK
jgi:hypothetical protein